MKTHHKCALIILALLLIGQCLFAFQINDSINTNNKASDTNFYSNLNNQFILRFFGVYKSNNVNLTKDAQTIRYRPNGVFNIGIGFNYKFLGLGISYGIPATKSSNDKYGKTQRLDVQLSIISKAFGLDAFLQAYQGYYMENPNDFLTWNNSNFPRLPDMRVLTIGLNAFYLVNNKKFSYRAAFIGNQVQNKSAGSIATGLFGNFDQVKTDNGFVPSELTDSANLQFDLKSFEAITVGLSVGYMYTFVLPKGVFISLAAVPGIGYRHLEFVNTENRKEVSDQFAFHLLGRIAIGYNNGRYFLNFNTLFNVRNYRYQSYEISLSTEQLRLTLGIRFATKASKKRNQFYPQ